MMLPPSLPGPCPSFHPAPGCSSHAPRHPLALWSFLLFPAAEVSWQLLWPHSWIPKVFSNILSPLTIHEYYRLAGFNQRTSFLTRLQAGKSGTKWQTNWSLVGALFLASGWTPSRCVFKEKEKASSLMSVTL